jgi:hypothetical protein
VLHVQRAAKIGIEAVAVRPDPRSDRDSGS